MGARLVKYTLIMATCDYDGQAELDVREIEAADDYEATRKALSKGVEVWLQSGSALLFRGDPSPVDVNEQQRAYDDHCKARSVEWEQRAAAREREQYERLKKKFEGGNG